MKNRRISASRPGLPRRETALYAPIRDYLVGNGYDVRAEVTHCDIVARKGDDLIIVELKRQFGVDLLVQATARQRISDSVYVAIPAPEYFGRGSRWTGLKRLLRHLELGLIVVFLDSSIPRVEVVFHPLPYQRRKRKAARRAALEEAASRSGDYNLGGSTQTKLVTAYRENAIHIACCLERFGPMAPCQLRALGTGPKTTAILGANFYGWFRRVHRAVYALTAEGKADLAAYPDLARQYREKLAQIRT
jgi:hypothetical protein